jgi:diguanylate cyclase (GGDEF)-like protein
MGIRTKTITLVTLVVALLGLALLGGTYVLATRVAAEGERSDMREALERTRAGLEQTSDGLRVFVGDWSSWDDTYNYVRGVNPKFGPDTLVTSTLVDYGVDFLYFTDLNGKIIGAVARDPNTGKLVPLPADLVAALRKTPPPTRKPGVEVMRAGFLGLHAGPVLYAAEAISTTNDDKPVDGFLIAGRYLGAERLADVQRFTLIPFELFSLNATLPPDVVAARSTLDQGTPTALSAVNRGTMHAYSYVNDPTGAPALVVRVTQPRVAVTSARQATVQFGLAFVAFVLALLLAVSFAMDRVVLRRLERLKADVASIGPDSQTGTRLSISGGDEISRVAESINGMLADIESSQTDLAYLADHDPLTHLYNRRRFEGELQKVLADRRSGGGALLWFDLDHFKEINDSLGHAAGDELLVSLAELLRHETREYCLLARLGGDEFGMLIPRASQAEAEATAQRIIDVMNGHAFTIAHHEVRIGASVGIVTFRDDSESADDLLASADLAMYHAKSSGRNRAVAYTSKDEWRTEMTERIGLSAAIVTALREERLELFAAPTRRLSDGSEGPFELLLRMRAEDGSLVFPNQIIPTAERIGLIRDIDRWVVSHAIALLADETAAGRETRLSVNVSGSAFSDPVLLDIICGEFEQTHVDPSRLTIEITETSAISDIGRAQAFIARLRGLGCRFALDDFGAGVSSFYYVKNLAVDDLKIDGTLVRTLLDNSADSYFVRAIVEMCRGLGMSTVAEYVEDDELLALVVELGVDFAQGDAIGVAMPIDRYFGA